MSHSKPIRYDSLRRIREEAVVKFFNRFSGHKLKGSRRQKLRQLERWLDGKGVSLEVAPDKMSFVVYMKGQQTCFEVIVTKDEKKKRYVYDYLEKNKDEVIVQYKE